ncbi:creatininase family protein [Dysgonomonas sp. Marseille-P4361]|uniref:creatininase family protein n=1 Tax=Dysgonomonas sp. Marseille-P4361 TaxID=2161820 RepID=UPI000D5599F3|nr:creatininase family protein [Dysgonomonas sp. Marseille-P4361]
MNPNLDLSKAKYHDIVNENYDYAVLPWGATEPHNYHLPYMTDCYLAYHISIDAVEKAFSDNEIKGMVLPYVPFGAQNPGQLDYPFCLHTSYQTQFSILRDIVASLDRQGINKLFIVNGHGGNSFKSMIRDLAVDYPDFIIILIDWFAVEPQEPYFDIKDDHAGEQETSVLMYYRPDLVDLSVAGEGKRIPFKSASLNAGVGWTPRNWKRVSPDTGTANPKKSSAEKGERYAKAVVAKIAKLFAEVVKDGIYQ